MEQTDPIAVKKSRKKLIMILTVFALPVILAKFSLQYNWLDYGVTNKGALVENELTLIDLGVNKGQVAAKWLIMYSAPKQCTSHCEQALENIHNTYVSLGKEMPRVRPVALLKSKLTTKQKERIDQSQWQLISTTQPDNTLLVQPQVFIVDPLGNVVMSHAVPKDAKELVRFGKNVLADMKKLLKYSRVG